MIIAHRIVVLLDFGLQADYFLLVFHAFGVGIFVEEEHEYNVCSRNQQRQRNISFSPFPASGEKLFHNPVID
jgi:hypothetical protein